MKIEEFTQKIYQEGIDKAKKKEQELLDAARQEGDRIIAEARQVADETVAAAKKEAEEVKEALSRELKQAGNLAVGHIKRRITDCLVDQVLPASVSEAMQDPTFIQKLILEIVGRWDAGQPDTAINVVLPAEDREGMAKHFASKAKQLFDHGLTVNFSNEVKNGFVVRPQDGTYKISFAEESFAAFFREFLRERTRKLLFPGDDTETGAAADAEKGE